MTNLLGLKKLKRYTHLPQLLHMLRSKTITVLAPETWEDQNDTYFLTRYKAARPNIKSLLALCMTDASDTYHHWRVYAGAPSGVQIRFNPPAFESWVDNHPNAKLGRVEYLHVDEFGVSAADVTRLPFLKRIAFRDEDEIRLIVEDFESVRRAFSLPFDLDMIEEIKLSPWLAEPLVETVIKTLADAYSGPKSKWEGIKITRTSLLANPRVMSAGDRYESKLTANS
jgi:hypothetical protein